MSFGSRFMSAATLRIAARSHSRGTPVKSWRTTRATTNGISSARGAFGAQFATWRTCCSVSLMPSQLRSTLSRTTRIETGSRDTFPMPAFSRAGSEWYLAVAPDASRRSLSVSNELRVILRSSVADAMPATSFAAVAVHGIPDVESAAVGRGHVAGTLARLARAQTARGQHGVDL